MGGSEEEVEGIAIAGYLHDVWKVGGRRAHIHQCAVPIEAKESKD